jgi:ParB family chromosome partitioning protein
MSSTTGKNRSILSGLVDQPAPVTDTPRPSSAPGVPPRAPERLSTRLSGLSRVASGDVKEKNQFLVDPARCRMWTRHNRRYDLLNEGACADLLESLRSQGEQEFPAIVRRVSDDPNIDYEVICGARRHWSVTFLRNVEHRAIKFLIEERDLDDEAAFRVSDVENRSRKDISDYERALDYRYAVEAYYGGIGRRMAERLEVREGWLSRFLDLAKMPQIVVEAFGDIHQLKENHARIIKPLLVETGERTRLMAEAKRLVAEQVQKRGANSPVIEAPQVIQRLSAAARGKPKAEPKLLAKAIHTNAAGARLFTLAAKAAGRATLELALDADASNADFEAAFQKALEALRPHS